MNGFMQSIINGSDIGKAVFLLVAGVLFVFAVQLVFYITIKLFVRFGKKKIET